MKYPFDNGKIGDMKWNQEIAKKFYQDSIQIKRAAMIVCSALRFDPHIINFFDPDPKE